MINSPWAPRLIYRDSIPPAGRGSSSSELLECQYPLDRYRETKNLHKTARPPLLKVHNWIEARDLASKSQNNA